MSVIDSLFVDAAVDVDEVMRQLLPKLKGRVIWSLFQRGYYQVMY